MHLRAVLLLALLAWSGAGSAIASNGVTITEYEGDRDAQAPVGAPAERPRWILGAGDSGAVLDAMSANPSPAEAMRATLAVATDSDLSESDRIVSLELLEVLVEPIDSANDLITLGGAEALHSLLDASPALAGPAMRVLAVAASNNARFADALAAQYPEVLEALLAHSAALLRPHEPSLGRVERSRAQVAAAAALQALSNLARAGSGARAAFFQRRGLELLGALLGHESVEEGDVKGSSILVPLLAQAERGHHPCALSCTHDYPQAASNCARALRLLGDLAGLEADQESAAAALGASRARALQEHLVRLVGRGLGAEELLDSDEEQTGTRTTPRSKSVLSTSLPLSKDCLTAAAVGTLQPEAVEAALQTMAALQPLSERAGALPAPSAAALARALGHVAQALHSLGSGEVHRAAPAGAPEAQEQGWSRDESSGRDGDESSGQGGDESSGQGGDESSGQGGDESWEQGDAEPSWDDEDLSEEEGTFTSLSRLASDVTARLQTQARAQRQDGAHDEL